MVCSELGRPCGAGDELEAEWREADRGQWKSTNQNRDSSSLRKGPDFIRNQGSSMCSGFQPGYQSRNWSTGMISAMVMTPK